MTDHEPAHARLGPSNARWVFCPGSVREEAAYEDISGDAAIDGTGSHLLLEMCLINGKRAIDYDMELIGVGHPDMPGGWNVQPDRCERVQTCLNYISARVELLKLKFPDCKVTVYAEARANPGAIFGRTDWWGTTDVNIVVTTIHNRCSHIEVIDYKDGRGWVGAKENTQLISYLIGSLRPYITENPEQTAPISPFLVGEMKMTIVQPKTNPPVRSEEIDGYGMKGWAARLNTAAIATDAPDAPLIPDNKNGKGYCKWCKHKPNCTARETNTLETIQMSTTPAVIDTNGSAPLVELSNGLLTDPKAVPVENLVLLAGMRPSIMSIFDKNEAEIERRVKAGDEVPGFAMLPGQGKRVWNVTEEELEKILKKRRLKLVQIFPPKIVTPAALMDNTDIPKKKRDAIDEELITFVDGKDKLTVVQVQPKEEVDTEALFANVPDFTVPDFTVPPSEVLSFT